MHHTHSHCYVFVFTRSKFRCTRFSKRIKTMTSDLFNCVPHFFLVFFVSLFQFITDVKWLFCLLLVALLQQEEQQHHHQQLLLLPLLLRPLLLSYSFLSSLCTGRAQQLAHDTIFLLLFVADGFLQFQLAHSNHGRSALFITFVKISLFRRNIIELQPTYRFFN